MRMTEFFDYINRKNKPSKKETDELYSHLNIEYEEVLKDDKKIMQLTKNCQKYEEIRKKRNNRKEEYFNGE